MNKEMKEENNSSSNPDFILFISVITIISAIKNGKAINRQDLAQKAASNILLDDAIITLTKEILLLELNTLKILFNQLKSKYETTENQENLLDQQRNLYMTCYQSYKEQIINKLMYCSAKIKRMDVEGAVSMTLQNNHKENKINASERAGIQQIISLDQIEKSIEYLEKQIKLIEKCGFNVHGHFMINNKVLSEETDEAKKLKEETELLQMLTDFGIREAQPNQIVRQPNSQIRIIYENSPQQQLQQQQQQQRQEIQQQIQQIRPQLRDQEEERSQLNKFIGFSVVGIILVAGGLIFYFMIKGSKYQEDL